MAGTAAETITLRTLREDDLETLVALELAEAEDFPHLGQGDVEARMRRRIRDSGRFVNSRYELGIEAGGRLVGSIQARQPKQGLPPGVFEIGIGLFPDDRGRGLGRRALELFTDDLFGSLRAGRVQASTSVANTAMRRVLERVGYSFEGVLRGFWQLPDGSREDYAMYAVTRADWDARAGSS